VQAALALWRRVGDPVREGAALGLLARAMWRLCCGEEADRAVTEALAVLEPLGPSTELAWAYANLATWRKDASEALLREALTRRELEVLVLVCDGHTNDEISNRLFISVKTVDHHVSSVLARLGVGSRKVAAAEAVRFGLVGART
jgi:DNA-binding CsgD family transcriptional regulator